MKKIVLFVSATFLLVSCAANKELEALKAQHEQTKDELLTVKNNLTKCLVEKEKYQDRSKDLETRVEELKKDKENTIQQVENLTVLSSFINVL